jgi:uncharacterized membrane protein
MDFILMALFILWLELFSLPLRWLLAGWTAPADVRRMLSRLAGPALLALPVWFAAHLGPGALARATGLVWLAFALAAALFASLRLAASPARLMAYEGGRRAWAREAALDAVMLVLALAFVGFRRWVPEMTTYVLDGSAAEKFANAMIFWSSWHAPQLPPQDYWLAGTTLPYYYWGHFHWAWLARLGGFPATVAINLGLTAAVTLTWTAGYLLARAARLGRGWAAAAGVAVAWAGNPAALAALKTLYASWRQFGGPFPWDSYDYWAPSRAILNVVDEFPAFSAILGDFHSHHLALPWLTGWLALTVAGRRWRGGAPGGTLAWAAAWTALAAAALLTNLWNLPLLGFTLCLALLASLRRGGRAFGIQLGCTLALGGVVVAGMHLLRSGAPLPIPTEAAQGLLARLPIRILPPELRTSPENLFGMWGFPGLVLALGALACLWPRKCGMRNAECGMSNVKRPMSNVKEPVAPCGTEPGIDPTSEHTRSSSLPVAQMPSLFHSAFRIPHSAFVIVGFVILLTLLTPLRAHLPGGIAWAWAGVGLWVAAMTLGRRPWISKAVALMLLGGCAVLAGLELVYMPDRFVGELVRYNSYFKFSYPIWPVLWVGGFAVARRLWHAGLLPAPVRWAARLALVAIALAAGVYATFAIPARVLRSAGADQPPRRPSLNAFDFVQYRPQYAVEGPLLNYIRKNVPAGERIAEGAFAVPATESMAYKYQGRIASLTGHPIPIGWAHHEQQWRGEFGYAEIDLRISEVNALYRSATPEEMRLRAAELGVGWIVYGLPEAALYGPDSLRVLQAAFPAAAAFPEVQPSVFLFEINANPNKMKNQ